MKDIQNYLGFLGNHFDTAILIITFISVLFALYKGFLFSFISTILSILSVFVALALMPYTKAYLVNHIHNHLILETISFIVSYMLAGIASWILNAILCNMLALFRGGIIDRILGIFFGILRGILFGSIIFWGILFALDDKIIDKIDSEAALFNAANSPALPDWLKNAKTKQWIIICSKEIYQHFNPAQINWLKQKVKAFTIDDLRNNIPPAYSPNALKNILPSTPEGLLPGNPIAEKGAAPAQQEEGAAQPGESKSQH